MPCKWGHQTKAVQVLYYGKMKGGMKGNSTSKRSTAQVLIRRAEYWMSLEIQELTGNSVTYSQLCPRSLLTTVWTVTLASGGDGKRGLTWPRLQGCKALPTITSRWEDELSEQPTAHGSKR